MIFKRLKSQLKQLSPVLKMFLSLKKQSWSRGISRLNTTNINSRIAKCLGSRRLVLEILSPGPDDTATMVDWAMFNHRLLFDGPILKIKCGPFLFKIPALTANDIEEMRHFAHRLEI